MQWAWDQSEQRQHWFKMIKLLRKKAWVMSLYVHQKLTWQLLSFPNPKCVPRHAQQVITRMEHKGFPPQDIGKGIGTRESFGSRSSKELMFLYCVVCIGCVLWVHDMSISAYSSDACALSKIETERALETKPLGATEAKWPIRWVPRMRNAALSRQRNRKGIANLNAWRKALPSPLINSHTQNPVQDPWGRWLM